jgi:hypothetical protein
MIIRKAFTEKQVENIAIHLNFKGYLESLAIVMAVESECDDITHGSVMLTARIAIRNLKENKYYYEKIETKEKVRNFI